MGAALDQAGSFINKTAFERIYRNVGKAMNVRCRKLCEELSNIAMCVNRSSSGQFVAAMQSLSVGHADLDPGLDPSSEISNENRRLVPSGDTFGQRNAVRVLETVCKHAHQHVVDGLGWLPRDTEVEPFVNAAIDVGQIDVKAIEMPPLYWLTLSYTT